MFDFVTSSMLWWSALVAAPIVIHLLNRRRFKTIDWAAMDFLLEADKKNRRRVQLENLLLLLLRCLAVLLVVFLVARPFVSQSLAMVDTLQYERIILLDDSLSMQAQVGNETSFDAAKRRILELCRKLAGDAAENTLSLITTSQPEDPVLNGLRIDAAHLADLADALEKLAPSDQPANLPEALQAVTDFVVAQPQNVNRVAYVVTDLRKQDWPPSEQQPEQPAVNLLKELAEEVVSVSLVDVGGEAPNVAVTEVQPAERTIVAGVPARFTVKVENFGGQEVRDLQVRFTAGEALPLLAAIDRIAPEGEAEATFNFTFTSVPDLLHGEANTQQVPVTVEIISKRPDQEDRLAADSSYFFAARVVPGVPVLIVDGAPSAAYARGESFYVSRGLAPPGDLRSGITVEVITDTELENAPLRNFHVVLLCNVYQLPQERIEELETWVKAGGSLVIAPGDQVDENHFNEHFYKGGEGLSPLRLKGIAGDETEETWAQIQVREANHPVLRIFEGQNNPFLDSVKVFRWWLSEIDEKHQAEVTTPALLTDADNSILLAEKDFGQGRVMMWTLPLDADWHNWPDDPSYLISVQESIRRLAGDVAGDGLLRVGQQLIQPIDLTEFKPDVSLIGPNELKANLRAAPLAGGSETLWEASFAGTKRRGMYEISLKKNNGEENSAQTVLFAANVDPQEGRLARADVESLRRELAESNITLVQGDEAAPDVNGSQQELWKYLLFALVGVLAAEQFLGWWFGRKR